MGDGFSKGNARSNPAFEPSESSSLMQPSSQNTVQVHTNSSVPSSHSKCSRTQPTSSPGASVFMV